MWPDAPPQTFESVVVRTTWLGSDESMHLKVLVGAVAEELRTIGSEIGESGDVLLRCEPGYLWSGSWACVSPFALNIICQTGKVGRLRD